MNRQIVGLRQVLASGKLSSLAGGEFVPRFEAASAQPAVFTSKTQMDRFTRPPREFRKPPFQPRTPLNPYAEVRTPAKGFYLTGLSPEDRVQAGQSLGRLVRLDTLQEVDVPSPIAGLVFRNGVVRPGKHETHESLSPVVQEGDSLAVVFAAPA